MRSRSKSFGRFLLAIAVCLVHQAPRDVSGSRPVALYFGGEPSVRIGLSTNSQSVTITTTEPSLIAGSVGELAEPIGSSRAFVEPRSYRPRSIERYRLELRDLPKQQDAEQTAAAITSKMKLAAAAAEDPLSKTWRIIVGEPLDTREEAAKLRGELDKNGFSDAVIVPEKKSQPDIDAILLSQQINSPRATKTEIRSLVHDADVRLRVIPSGPVDPSLKEIAVSGSSEESRFSSLRPLTFGSITEKTPVKVNGKTYRGKIEIFVNSRGTLSVINVVPIEEYLLGVVPNELGFPSLEAQKAQAVAARTYAIANINGFARQGFDLTPTVASQVYGGVESETAMSTRAVNETRGLVATYLGKPINALYTSTCGGRTEDARNVFEFDVPYLKGVECSLEPHKHFEAFTIKSNRELPKVANERDGDVVKAAALLSINGFVIQTSRVSDEWLNAPPSETEMRSWYNQIALRVGRSMPNYSNDLIKTQNFASALARLLYSERESETLMSDSDVSYILSFFDAVEIDRNKRSDIAILLRDGYLTVGPDGNLYPNRPLVRKRMIRIIDNLFRKKKWYSQMQMGSVKSVTDGKLTFRIAKADKTFGLSAAVYLFREFGGDAFQVREAVLMGGEPISFQTNSTGEIVYLEIEPTQESTSAERMSPHTFWEETVSVTAMQSRLSRYVKGVGNLLDMKVTKVGFSRRATELQLAGSNGIFSLKGGKIRSALGLKEQLFVVDRNLDEKGKLKSFSFRGRGWGHGVGMCQYGAYGLAKMGLSFDRILKHYYTGIDLTKSYS